MKRIVGLMAVLSLMVGCLGWFGMPQSAIASSLPSFMLPSSPVLMAEVNNVLRNRADDKLSTDFGSKIDLNNTSVRSFRQLPGMFPVLAGKIVQNAPYHKVEDVLDIPGLSERQKELLQGYFDNFAVTDVETVFNEGGDRYNNGIY
ncbi:MAG: photosystem II complex extrinsic protein PsbU [Coleofasciculaceae cyanobacterium]